VRVVGSEGSHFVSRDFKQLDGMLVSPFDVCVVLIDVGAVVIVLHGELGLAQTLHLRLDTKLVVNKGPLGGHVITTVGTNKFLLDDDSFFPAEGAALRQSSTMHTDSLLATRGYIRGIGLTHRACHRAINIKFDGFGQHGVEVQLVHGKKKGKGWLDFLDRFVGCGV